ncbi:DNA methylase N-4/N-6 domain protein (modular protein) [Candidatus Glomeribacter gigasporarum BEG34]|uniref:Methyltransferase n=2 Tax=Candidatus Glomeribacter gigasporarum TaxID=132144 RepID=G2JBB7_9BURK|nr:DNA methylase N-4/N-6 domain protein (modular protein) [Candidatus Glomeribacter gigasporarum BEG34]
MSLFDPAQDESLCQILYGDSSAQLRPFVDQVDLILTSPPYADARKRHYASIRPQDYADWFIRFHPVFWQALKAHGSFILNLKGKIVDGVRHRYVWHTIERLTQLGWHCIDDYIWHKKTSMPGFWPTRLRDGWEYLFHLAKTQRPYVNHEAVKRPIAASSWNRIQRIQPHEYAPHLSETGSGFRRAMRAWIGKTHVLPDNVLHVSPEARNKGHPAVYPVALPRFFIRLLTKPGDLVVDPFAGSGTTGIAALQLQRRCLLIDNHYPYCVLAAQRIRAETGVHASGEYLSAPVPARARLTLESQAAIKRTAHAAGP